MDKDNQASWFTHYLHHRHLLSTRARRRRFLISAGIVISLGIIQHKHGWATPNPRMIWRSPEEIAAIGFKRSRVVMMNEALSGLERNIRSREVGLCIFLTVHAAGVRYTAMEVLTSEVATEVNRSRQLPKDAPGYLAQPEWTLDWILV